MPRGYRKPNMNAGELTEWFFNKLNKLDSGCWEWTGTTAGAGYGTFKFMNKRIYTHRFALEYKLGRPIENGMEAGHLCHNMLCCNPVHLYETSHAENMNDMKLAGRQTKGEKNPVSTLTDNQIIEIRALQDLFSRNDLGKMFGVKHQTISKILLFQRRV